MNLNRYVIERVLRATGALATVLNESVDGAGTPSGGVRTDPHRLWIGAGEDTRVPRGLAQGEEGEDLFEVKKRGDIDRGSSAHNGVHPAGDG